MPLDRLQLFEEIKKKKSFLCVGLDTDIQKIPKHLLSTADPVFEFNKAIIDATKDFCVAYKINTAFYEANGVAGWQALQKTFDYIPKNIFTIADAKRGDIGNTSSMYARAFFDKPSSGFDFDAVTVAPYMGKDSVAPFLEFEKRWVILLALTSNKGSHDFQYMTEGNEKLFERVIRISQTWGNENNMMYVVGATHASEFAKIRELIPHHFLLVPGVGTQGGDLEMLCKFGMNDYCGLLVNVSRQIIFASTDLNFSEAAKNNAIEFQQQMEVELKKVKLIS